MSKSSLIVHIKKPTYIVFSTHVATLFLYLEKTFYCSAKLRTIEKKEDVIVEAKSR